jgi:peptidoglycan/xylan/chitin deacetylase (PgdA/CDA1 family)
VPVRASQVLAPSGQLCFAVTLDDGYEDNFRVAAPILRRLGVPATFFVVSDYVQTGRLFWWEQLAQMLRATRERRIDLRTVLPELAAGSDAVNLPLATHEARWRSYERLSAMLRTGSHVELAGRMARIAEALGVRPRDEGRDYGLMSWAQLQELARQGFEIGGHTATHSNVFGASERLLQAEIVASARAIESRIGAPVLSFAYPYGHYDRHDPTVARLLNKSGCQVAFTGHAGVVQGRPDPYLLPRATLNRPFGFACAYNVQDALSRQQVAPA